MLTDLFLTINAMRYHALDWGGPQTAQPILLVHGLASNAKIWNFVAPGLAENFRVVAVDQRSHGLTDPPPDGDYGFSAMCSDLHTLCTELQFARPIIVGHSWGASVALEYASRYPSETVGIVMVDGGFAGMGQRMTWEETEQRLAPPRLAGTLVAAFQERAKSFMGEMYNEERFDAILGNFEVRADGTIAPHLAFENHMKIVRAMWEQDPTVLYPSITSPALFLPCVPSEPHDDHTKEMINWKRSSAQMISELMSHAQFDWLTDSIHDVPVQKPQLVIDKLSSFANTL